jgi:hypothetical protein
MRPAAPMVEGGETLSFELIGKMYPRTGTIPEPIAGLEIGRGATTKTPGPSFFFFFFASG